MYKEFFVHSPVLALPVIALGIFVVVFVMVVIRTMFRKKDQEEQLVASLPLLDDVGPKQDIKIKET